MNKKILPRHAAGAFELKEGAGPITGMCPCGDFLEIYKADKTFRVQSPESTDSEQTNPNAIWITTPVSDVGTKNPIVSRILLQGHDILKGACFQQTIDKEAVTLLLHKCKEHLLICDKVAKKIAAEVDRITLKIQTDGIGQEKNARGLNPFPHVSDLTADCGTFLSEAKRAIYSICELPAIFFALEDIDNNFDNLASRLATKLEHNNPVLNFIISNASNIKHIIELRNFHEHPKKMKTIIENFRCTPNIQIVAPQWHVTGDEARPIKEEMEAIVNYLLEIAEAMLIHLVMVTVKKEFAYTIEKIEDSKINQAAPIRYRLSLDLSKMNFPK